MRPEKIIFFSAVGFIVIVLLISVIRVSNGHPPEDCPKVDLAQPRSHFLSTPQIVVPSKKDKIKEFQKKHALKPDGLVGPDTRKACYKQCWGGKK